jgi:uncharacterized damage-inducible protein DinB
MIFSRDALRDLLAHMEWADAAVWATVPADGPPDEKLRATLVHIHTVQQAFLKIWTGADPVEAFCPPESFPRLASVRAWAQPGYAALRGFVDRASAEALAAETVMPWAEQITARIGQPPAATTLAETCVQVASHSTYHRGQANRRLREMGVEPPLVDYIAWIWMGRPPAVWNR